MQLTEQHILGLQKWLIEIDEEKDRVIYKNLRNWEKNIENFTETHINIFWNELGLVIWKEYTMLKDLPNFIEGKKYKLNELVWFWDWVFIWEDWEEHVFFDKEFDEFWQE